MKPNEYVTHCRQLTRFCAYSILHIFIFSSSPFFCNRNGWIIRNGKKTCNKRAIMLPKWIHWTIQWYLLKNKITCWNWQKSKRNWNAHFNGHDFMDTIILRQNIAIMAYRLQNYKIACWDLNICLLQLIRTLFVLVRCVSIEMQMRNGTA